MKPRKKTVSEAENELVVRIPLVVGFRPVIVEPRAVIVAFEVENFRVAVRIGFVRRAFLFNARLMP